MAIGKLPDDSGDEEGGEGIFAEINITPLTDVFLVMVIIFMVSALAAQVEKNQQKQKIEKKEEIEQKSGIKVNLPQGQAQEIDPSKVSLILTVPLEGDIQVANKPVADGDLENLFRASYARDKNTQVILKVDKGVPHGKVVNLMERVKATGLTRLAFGTSS